MGEPVQTQLVPTDVHVQRDGLEKTVKKVHFLSYKVHCLSYKYICSTAFPIHLLGPLPFLYIY